MKWSDAWPRLANATLGMWLVGSSMVWRQTRLPAVNTAICGFLAIAFAVTGLLTGKPTRLLNVILGLWLILSAIVFPRATSVSTWNQGIVGYAVMLFGFIPRSGPRNIGPTAPVNF